MCVSVYIIYCCMSLNGENDQCIFKFFREELRENESHIILNYNSTSTSVLYKWRNASGRHRQA